jgi:hypothetical protein
MLSLEISAFGEVAATFLYDQFHPDDVVNPRQADFADADLTLADGRTVTFKRCGVSRRTVTLGEPGSEWKLLPLETTVRTPTVKPSRAEFGLVNFWRYVDWPPLSFGGHQFDLNADLPNHHGYRDLQKGDRAPLMYWATTDLRPADDVRRVWEVTHHLADTVSMLLHERILTPCCRIVDADGRLAEFHFRLQGRWPVVSNHMRYTTDERAALETVGRADVCEVFASLDLSRYVNYILEARRKDLCVELSLACALMALECISGRWQIARGVPEHEVATRKLVQKLKCMNKTLGCIESRYLGDWLRASLRNPLMHTGAVPTMTLLQIDEATNELLVLATDIFFRIFGFVRETASA